MARTRRQLLEIERSAAVQLVPLRDVDRSRLDSPARDALEIAEAVLSRRRFDAVFVHGDFAPINVIVDEQGRVSALLDFEHAHVGDPLEDVAWWSWVVRHHHPDAWRASWSTFCDLAGVDRVADGPVIHALMIKELARRAAGVRGAHDHDRWLARLIEAAAWRP
jgi:aminoglycoside phosphotransferase